jgi:predicted nucleic acid-binding protein
VATTEQTYVDPSALSLLYLHQEGSRQIADWRARTTEPLVVTHHGRTEIVNAICRAVFREQINEKAMDKALSVLAADFANGRLHQADILWRAALNRAAGLSQTYTSNLGTRASDVLHVACALELKLRYFLSFDQRQQKLAVATGLKLVRL